jgi:anti-sigma regulatory factor (Ser/Thr protein kinase)
VASLSLRHSPASAAIARRSIASAFHEAGLSPDQAFDAALIASELVGNAIRHGLPLPSGQISMQWMLEADGYYIGVTDGGNASRVTPQPTEPHSISGRGLMIVAALSRDWGVSKEGNATTVWARASLTPDRLAARTVQSATAQASSGQNLQSAGYA